MDKFFNYDSQATAAKGLVYIGEKILVYRRDNKTTTHPLEIDLPGGGIKDMETPFQAFQREVKEEFGLYIIEENITYVRRYTESDKSTYFVVAKLPIEVGSDITFGNEGKEYNTITLEDYLNCKDAWILFQERTKDYLQSTTK